MNKKLLSISLLILLTGCSIPTDRFSGIPEEAVIEDYSGILNFQDYKSIYRIDILSINGETAKDGLPRKIFKPGDTSVLAVCSTFRDLGNGGYTYIPYTEILIDFKAKKNTVYSIQRLPKHLGTETRYTNGTHCYTNTLTNKKTCQRLTKQTEMYNPCFARLETYYGSNGVPARIRRGSLDNNKELSEYSKFHSKLNHE